MNDKKIARLSVQVPTNLNEKIEELKTEKMLSKNALINMILEEYFNKLRRKKS